MIRFGDSLRLSVQKARQFTELTGFPAPRSVSAYNRLLQIAAQDWAADDMPEGRLMAAILEGMVLDASGEDTKSQTERWWEDQMTALSDALKSVRVSNGKIVKPSRRERRIFSQRTGFVFPTSLRSYYRYQALIAKTLAKNPS